MKREVAVLLILTAGANVLPAQIQYGRSKVQKPDVYTFAPEDTPARRYRRDGEDKKQITNNDFFCSRCAAEGRIAQKTRGDMRGTLEVVKEYGYVFKGKRKHVCGRYRLIEQNAEHVLRYLSKELKAKNPCYIEDRLFKLYCDLPPMSMGSKSSREKTREIALLRDIFPELAKNARRFNSHQRAHLYLIRAHRVLEDFSALVNHEDGAAYMRDVGPFLGNREKFELLLFPEQEPAGAFVDSYLSQNKKLEGIWWHTPDDDSMVLVASAPKAKDSWLHRHMIHRLSFNLMMSWRGYYFEMPMWITKGYAHLMERREGTDYNTFTVGEGLIPPPWEPADWKKAVRKMVKTKKYSALRTLAADFVSGVMAYPDRAIAWSMVSFLVQKDPDEFGRFIRLLKDMPEDGDMYRQQQTALRRIYGWTFEDFESAWSDWVLKNYPR